MSKKPPAKERSDFSPTPIVDEVSPVPAFGIGDIQRDIPAIDDDQNQDDIETDRQAAPYWHPAWAPVQEKFEEFLEIHGYNSAESHRELPADEFKIRMLVDAECANLVERLMEDVKRAVESVESRPKPTKQPKSGA
jgi:hypothetical protein